MPPEVIDLLAGMNVEQAIALAIGTSALFAIPYLAFVNVDRLVPQRLRDAHFGELAQLHAEKAVLQARIWLVAALLVVIAHLDTTSPASKKGATR